MLARFRGGGVNAVDARGELLALRWSVSKKELLLAGCWYCARGPLGVEGLCWLVWVGDWTGVEGLRVGVAGGGTCATGAGAGVAPLRIERSVPACPKSGGFEGTGGGMNASSGVSGSCGVGCG